jgi:hypothetical protein
METVPARTGTGVAPEPVGQALFERCVPAVRFTVAIAVYIQTPGTILSLSWPFDADDSCESAHDDKQQPYGRLLVARSHERLYLLFIPCSREGAADCDEYREAVAIRWHGN